MDLESRDEVAMRRKPESMSEEIGRREVCEYIHRRRTDTRIYGSLLPVGGEEEKQASEVRVLGASIGATIIVQQTR